jgi:type III secretion protein J
MLVVCTALLTACNVDLFSELDQRQANEIVATLFRHGIPAERVTAKSGRFGVMVDEGHFAEAIAVLNESGLPRQEFKTLCDVFKKDGIVSSLMQERAQMICALEQELSRTISEIDGVLSARVHLVLPENDPLRQQLVPSSASVAIRHQDNVSIDAEKVKLLVTNGVAGLSYDKVQVAFFSVPVQPHNANDAGTSQMANFMGILVHSRSLETLSTVFFGLLTALFLTGGALAYVLWNLRQRVYSLQKKDSTDKRDES